LCLIPVRGRWYRLRLTAAPSRPAATTSPLRQKNSFFRSISAITHYIRPWEICVSTNFSLGPIEADLRYIGRGRVIDRRVPELVAKGERVLTPVQLWQLARACSNTLRPSAHQRDLSTHIGSVSIR
jgi:hypothetical protein